ncbi:MAG: serine--tRNA ligase, partial [Muribaculaceae bacterium]|nr:serine--tRNA ligase [Muribaculaceae bacterium]
MLTLAAIKENPDDIIRRLARKHFDAKELIEKVIETDKVRRATQAELDSALSQIKTLSSQIGMLMKNGEKEKAEEAKQEVASLKEKTTRLDEEMTNAEKAITEILLTIPNTPCDLVPDGRTAEDNVVAKEGGNMPDLSEEALPHWELAKIYDLIDFELGVKISGAGFPVYKGNGARLQRALI